ncbi:adenylate kinase [bacterium]|nr:adenylate kinase [bacterium]
MLERNLVIFGPPGAGKGTQAQKLTALINIPHISTGDMFRTQIKNKTALGLKAKAFSDKGSLVPDEITIAMVKDRLSQPDIAAGYLLDGFPRSVPQAEALQAILETIEKPIRAVINIMVTDAEIFDRLKKRAQIEGRMDDADPNVIQNRIKTYKEQSEPCLDFYRPRGLVKDINGLGTIEAVFQRISEALDLY